MTDKPTPQQIDIAVKETTTRLMHCPHVLSLKELMLECVSNKRGWLAAKAVSAAFSTGAIKGPIGDEFKELIKSAPLPEFDVSSQQQAEASVSHAVGAKFFSDRKMLCPQNAKVFSAWFEKHPEMAKIYRDMALTNPNVTKEELHSTKQLADHWCQSQPKYDASHNALGASKLLGTTLPMADEIIQLSKPAVTPKREPSSTIAPPPRTPAPQRSANAQGL